MLFPILFFLVILLALWRNSVCAVISSSEKKDEAHTKKSERENKIENKRKTDFLFELMFTYNNIFVRWYFLLTRSFLHSLSMSFMVFASMDIPISFLDFTPFSVLFSSPSNYYKCSIFKYCHSFNNFRSFEAVCVKESRWSRWSEKDIFPNLKRTSSISRVDAQKNNAIAFWLSKSY